VTLSASDAGSQVAILSDQDGGALAAQAGRDSALVRKQQVNYGYQPTLVYADGTLYRLSVSNVHDYYPMVVAVRASDGTVLWPLKSCSDYDDTLYRDAGLLYVTGGGYGPASSDTISHESAEAVDPLTGHAVWSVEGGHV